MAVEGPTARSVADTAGANLIASDEHVLDALHEAGHAVIRSLLKRPFRRVRLAGSHGPARIDFDAVGKLTGDDLDREVICALAGVVAEACIVDGRDPLETVLGGLADQAAVRDLLGPRACDVELVDQLLLRTLRLVERSVNPIKRVARALLVHRQLSADEVAAVVAQFAL